MFQLADSDPRPLEVWTHHSGRQYYIFSLSNLHATDHIKFPVTVSYVNMEGTPKLWSRVLEKWHPSFSPTGTMYTGPYAKLVDSLFPKIDEVSKMRGDEYTLVSYKHSVEASPTLDIFTTRVREELREVWIKKIAENAGNEGTLTPSWQFALVVNGFPSSVRSPEELIQNEALGASYSQFASLVAATTAVTSESDREWEDVLKHGGLDEITLEDLFDTIEEEPNEKK